jgi:hypothetical protein
MGKLRAWILYDNGAFLEKLKIMRHLLLGATLFCLLGCSPAQPTSAETSAAKTRETALGAWTASESRSATGDLSVSTASISSKNELNNSVGIGQKAQMLVRCSDNNIDTLFIWPAFVRISGELKVEFQIDNGQIFSYTFQTSGGGSAFGFRGSSESEPFLSRLQNAKQLVVRAEDINKTSQDAVFNVSSIAQGTASVMSACGGSLGGK